MSDAAPTAKEFQRRRSATWRAVRWWLIIAAAGVIAIASLMWNAPRLPNDHTIAIGLVLVVIVVGSLVITRIRVYAIYRCPACSSVPIVAVPGWRDQFGNEPRDVQWNPERCPHCGARLR
jgi:DNA-directed RNA polymerase subunit RPC12/RpoP